MKTTVRTGVHVDASGDSRRAGGCAIAFGLPFLLGGIAAFVAMLAQKPRPGDGAVESVVRITAPLAFVVVGLGIVAFGIHLRRSGRDEAERRQRHPGEPWMWRSDWAQGFVGSGEKAKLAFIWSSTAIWNLISAPILVLVPGEAARGKPQAWIAMAFPLVGALLLIWAIRATLRYRRFGAARLHLVSRPGVVGGWFRARLELPEMLRPEDGFQLRISSIRRRIIRSGGKTRSDDDIVWQDEMVVPADRLQPSPRGAFLPVEVAIPGNARPTSEMVQKERHLWMLHVDADVPGIDLALVFEIPVFKTSESRTDFRPPVETASPDTAPRIGDRAGVRVSRTASGIDIRFAAFRARSLAISTLAFLLFWIGAIVAMPRFGAPIFFPIIFGLIAIPVGWAGLSLLFGTDRVVVEGSQLRHTRRILGIGRTVTIPATQVTSVQIAGGIQQGEAHGRRYWEIQLRLSGGKKRTVGRHLASRRQADSIKDLLEKSLSRS